MGHGDYESLSRRVDRLARQTGCAGGTGTGFESGAFWSPPTDVFETEDDVVVKMELPGVGEGDLSIVLVDHRLVVHGCRRDPESAKKIAYHQMEIAYGNFAKIVTIRMPYDREGIHARLADGFLRLVIPKATRPAPEKVAVEIRL